jgi:hypothetical protein
MLSDSNGIRSVDRRHCKSIGIETRLQAGLPGFESRQGLGIFSSLPRPYRRWGPPNLLSNGYRMLLTRG